MECLNANWIHNTAATKIDSNYSNTAITLDSVNKSELSDLETRITKIENNLNKPKENNNMKNLTFDFGPCNDDQVRMSMYGLAVKNASGAYVSYDNATGTLIDVDILNFKGAKYFYKMPSALAEVNPNDIIIHARKPMIVIENHTKSLTVIDPIAGEKKEILPTISPFGFNFITKIFCPFNPSSANASSANPFGNNLFPLMFMDDENLDNNTLFMLMAMNGNTSLTNNPMLLYCLMGEGKDSKSLLPLLLMNIPSPTANS